MSGTKIDPRHRDPDPSDFGPPQPSKGYALSGKIMLSAIVVLFFVVILMVCLHLYARWYLLRARRRHLRRNRHNRRTHIVFHDDHSAAAVSAGARGLDASILNSLPVFVFDSKSKSKPQSTHMSAVAHNNLKEEQPTLECAVCLSEFEDNETGRLLPKCSHSFHIECIDMWFQSHSTCPLCRAPVESGPGSETRPVVVITVSESVPGEPGPSSDSVGGPLRTASFGGRVKPLDIVVPPRRNESFEEDSGCGESPASQAFRSPMSRMLSFRRIISRDRRNGGVSPTAGCSSVAESDIELGGGGGQETELTRREQKQG